MHKKLVSVLLLMALVTLPACSQNPAPSATESPAASDIALPTPTPTSTPTPVVLPDYMPPTDFEVDSVWRAEPFGNQGGALIYMSDITDGAFSFKLYMYQYVHEQDSIDRRMNLSTITAAANYDGEKYIFSADRGHSGSVGLDGLIKLDGVLSFSEGTISLEYADALLPEAYQGSAEFRFDEVAPSISYEDHEWATENFTTFLPTDFTLLPEDEVGAAMYELPLYEGEIYIPFTNNPTPEDLEGFLGAPATSVRYDGSPVWIKNTYESAELSVTEYYDQAGKLCYHVWGFTSGDQDVIPEVRGVTIGIHIAEVISRFPCEFGSCEDILASAPDDGDVKLYASSSHGYNFGLLKFESRKPTEAIYIAGLYVIKYHFDNTGHVESIEYADDGY